MTPLSPPPKCHPCATKDEPILSVFRGRIEKLVFWMDQPGVSRPFWIKTIYTPTVQSDQRLSRSLSLFKLMVPFDRHL